MGSRGGKNGVRGGKDGGKGRKGEVRDGMGR